MLRIISLFQTASYSERFPAFRTIREEDLFVPMDCCALAIPVAGDIERDTDIFLDTVLKLLQLNRGYTVGKLSELMCVHSEFIRFIIIRLREKGFLNERNEISEAGKRYLASGLRTADDQDKQVSAYIFSRGTPDSLLSYIHTDQLRFENAKLSGSTLALQFGSSGNPVYIEGRFLRERGGNRSAKRLPQAALCKLIARYNQMCSQMSGYHPIPYRPGYMIDVSTVQSVILHCKAVIQEGNSDTLLISDGFSLNCDRLTREILAKYPELEGDILGRAARVTQGQGDGDGAAVPLASTGKYAEIIRRLSPQRQTGSSIDAAAEATRYNSRILRELYEAVEWAFLYSVRQYPPTEQLTEFFRSHSAGANELTIKSLSKQIGMTEEPPRCFLCQLNRSGIDRTFKTGVPVLGTVLPLAIAAAAENRAHPMHRALQGMSDAFSFFAALQERAKAVRHEAGANVVTELELADYANRVRRWIKLLLPDIQLDRGGQVQQQSGASQRRINARFSLSNALGWEVYQRLDHSLQEELILISPDKTAEELPPAGEFVFSLSRILEHLFREYLIQDPSPSAGCGKAEIIGKVEAFFHTKIPAGIAQVGDSYLASALTGRNATLNAYYVALLVRCAETNKAEGRALLEQDAALLIGTISRLREHTAEAALSYRTAELFPFRDTTFRVIKILSEL